MTWEQIESRWDHYRNDAQTLWNRLSEDELEVTHGRRDRLIDKVRDAYHLSQEEAAQQVDGWVSSLHG